MAEEIYGLTLTQNQAVERLVKSSRNSTRPATGLSPPNAKYPGLGRVIIFDTEDPTYDPTTTREVALFRFNPTGTQKTVEFSGQNLEGDLVLTLAGTEYQIPCASTTAELRAILNLDLQDCRVTVFPGYWEFDFNNGQWAGDAPSFTIDAYEPEDEDDPVFDGTAIITDEGWVSVTDDGDTYKTIEINDWVPFLTGAVKAGSIGLIGWSHEAGWISLAWQCRDWSFAEDGY